METLWAHGTDSYNKIVNEGIMLSDTTFIKGFPSYSADASIVRLTLTGLPFLQLRLLKSDLHQWLTQFGEVLDYGLSKKDGYYVGGGYATIAIPSGTACSQLPCNDEHTHFIQLDRVVPWQEDDGDFRKITLTWDAMPDFCRCCGSSKHCRADCPDLYSWMKCNNCHEKGHHSYHCPRNNKASGTEAPSKTRAVSAEPKKLTRKTPLKVNNSTTSPMIVDPPTHPANTGTGTTEQQKGIEGTGPGDGTGNGEGQGTGKETTSDMEGVENTAGNSSKNRSPSPDLDETKKLAKAKQADDVADSRKQQLGQQGTINANGQYTGTQQPNGPNDNTQQQNNGTGAPSDPHGKDQAPPPNQQ